MCNVFKGLKKLLSSESLPIKNIGRLPIVPTISKVKEFDSKQR